MDTVAGDATSVLHPTAGDRDVGAECGAGRVLKLWSGFELGAASGNARWQSRRDHRSPSCGLRGTAGRAHCRCRLRHGRFDVSPSRAGGGPGGRARARHIRASPHSGGTWTRKRRCSKRLVCPRGGSDRASSAIARFGDARSDQHHLRADLGPLEYLDDVLVVEPDAA